jgi:hypothetical protein
MDGIIIDASTTVFALQLASSCPLLLRQDHTRPMTVARQGEQFLDVNAGDCT